MTYDSDAFISYAHLDNVELIEGRKGWVTNLHRALEIRVGQLLGKSPQIWRDPKLQGNDFFADTLTERLRRVAVLVSVVSPRYVRSEWTRRELTEFWKAAEQQGGIHVATKARIFKILKTPVPLEAQSAELQSLLGYEFFKVDAETGKVRELDEVFGPEAQRDFWIKLDDVAHEICALLKVLEGAASSEPAEEPTRGAVFLAETTADVREQRDVIRRDLLQHGFAVLPSTPLRPVAADIEAAVRDDLARCTMSIHPIGKNYSLVPEGATSSLVEIQNELAIERSSGGDFTRLVWIPPGLQIDDERQRRVVDHVRTDPRIQRGADLLETPLEDLRTLIEEMVSRKEAPVPAPKAAHSAARLYLIYDRRDSDAVSLWADFLFDQGLEVIHPIFEGDETDVREYHEENLCQCDGALILFGSANEGWVRRKLRELQKSAGYGRTKSAPAVVICAIPPKTAEKERFRTHDAAIIPQWDGFSPDPWRPLVSRLKGEEGPER